MPARLPSRRLPARGFTLAELVAVLTVLGVLAAVALPRLGTPLALRSEAERDQLLGALRGARAAALGHRRLVCAELASEAGADTLRLRIAASNPASACNTALPGVGGDPAVRLGRSGAAQVQPAGVLYFQPSGRITRDGAGRQPADRQIVIDGAAPLLIVGETGLMR